MSVVLLEDKHEAPDAWKPVDSTKLQDDDTIKVGEGFALKLTIGVGLLIALTVASVLFGPMALRKMRLYRSAMVKPKGKKKHQPLVRRRAATVEVEDVEEDEDEG